MGHSEGCIVGTALYAKRPFNGLVFNYDIVEGLQQIACPVLAINGSKDFQSSVEFAKRIPENVKGPSTCVVVENMDHGLKEQLTPISPSTFKKDYIKTIGKPIHADAIKHLDAWLTEWKEGAFQVAGEN